MTVSIDAPALDLAPTVPSRVVYGTVLIPTEDRGPHGAWIEAAIPGEIKLPGEHTTITGRSKRVPVQADGSFQIRLPTTAAGIEPEDWALSIRLSWRPVAFPMRVPVGAEPIWIEDCLFPELVPGEDPSKYFLAGFQIRSVETVGPDEPASVSSSIEAGVVSTDWRIPRGAQGLPGVNAIENDEAVAGYIDTAGESATKAALDENYAARDLTATASKETIAYWVAPDGDDTATGAEGFPFRTIAKALSMVPDRVRADHVYTITLTPGTWDEMVTLDHRIVDGQVIITGSTTDRAAHRVRAVRCNSVIGYLTIRNLSTTIKTASGASFRFYRCAPMVEVENVKAEADPSVEKGVEGVIGLLADYGSQVLVRGSDFGGKRYGMRSNYLSRIFSHNNTGSGSTFGLGARWGGIMSTYGTQPTGDTNLTNSSGGILAFEQGGKLGIPAEIGLIDQKGHGDTSPSIKNYFITSNVAGINGDIASGQKIRCRFRAPQDGYLVVKVAYGAQTGSTGAQSIEKHFMGMMRRTSISPVSSARLTYQSMGDDTVTLTHSGADGVFYVDVAPLAALAGRWGLSVEVTFFRALEAPMLQSVTLV